jgi:hypothetical protein
VVGLEVPCPEVVRPLHGETLHGRAHPEGDTLVLEFGSQEIYVLRRAPFEAAAGSPDEPLHRFLLTRFTDVVVAEVVRVVLQDIEKWVHHCR